MVRRTAALLRAIGARISAIVIATEDVGYWEHLRHQACVATRAVGEASAEQIARERRFREENRRYWRTRAERQRAALAEEVEAVEGELAADRGPKNPTAVKSPEADARALDAEEGEVSGRPPGTPPAGDPAHRGRAPGAGGGGEPAAPGRAVADGGSGARTGGAGGARRHGDAGGHRPARPARGGGCASLRAEVAGGDALSSGAWWRAGAARGGTARRRRWARCCSRAGGARPSSTSFPSGATAQLLLSDPEMLAMARDMLRDGFVPPTERNAFIYARGLRAAPEQAQSLAPRLVRGIKFVTEEPVGGATDRGAAGQAVGSRHPRRARAARPHRRANGEAAARGRSGEPAPGADGPAIPARSAGAAAGTGGWRGRRPSRRVRLRRRGAESRARARDASAAAPWSAARCRPDGPPR